MTHLMWKVTKALFLNWPETDKYGKCLIRNEKKNLPSKLKPTLNLSNSVNKGKHEIKTH